LGVKKETYGHTKDVKRPSEDALEGGANIKKPIKSPKKNLGGEGNLYTWEGSRKDFTNPKAIPTPPNDKRRMRRQP